MDRHRALGIGLLKGPRGWLFLMSEVPLQPTDEQGGGDLNGFKDIRTETGSSDNQNLALTGLQGHLTYKKTHSFRTLP